MDIDDLAGTLPTVTTVLRAGGWFVASIVLAGTGRLAWNIVGRTSLARGTIELEHRRQDRAARSSVGGSDGANMWLPK